MEDLERKRTRGSVKKELDVRENAKSSGERLNQHLTYDVLRIIFKYLNGMDLSSVSMVCRSWLEAANNEKRTRGPVCLVEDYEKILPNQKWTMEYTKTNIIKNLTIKPALGLFFAFSSVQFDNQDCPCKVLPSNCDTVILGTHGLVINNREIEDILGNIVCAFLPKIPNVTIGTFVLEEDSSTKRDLSKSGEKYSEELKKILGIPERDSSKSRCLLFFCNPRGRSLAIKILNSLKRCYPGDILSVWGGVARDLVVCNSKNSKRNLCGKIALCVGIALIGSIDTWSIIVDKTCKTKEQVEERLKSLRDRVSLKKHSMAFMFACCARGEDMFDENGVESSIFKTLFPEVPLVGCFGDGEFGENTVPSENRNKKMKWYNEKSTVFMILTYG